MLAWISLEEEWSVFRIALPTIAAVMALATLLAFVWRFDVASSPTWQLVLHHLMLGLFLSATFVLGAHRSPCLGDLFRRVMSMLAIVFPAAVFSGSWVMHGAFEGFRDERFLELAVVSATSFMMLYGAAAFLRVSFVFARELARSWPCRCAGPGGPS